MKVRVCTGIVVLVLTVVLTIAPLEAQEATFMGKSAEELFPRAMNDVERNSAMEALLAANLPDARDRFAGKTITVGSGYSPFDLIDYCHTFYFWRTVFETVTGAELEIVEIPFPHLYLTTATDFITETYTYDAIIVPSWLYGDYITNDWIRPVDCFWLESTLSDDCRELDVSAAYPQWELNTVLNPFQEMMTWQGRWYGVWGSGDTTMLYYRRDVLENPKWQASFEKEAGMPMPVPPRTWQDLLAITRFFNGKDWNGDGDTDDGISLHLRGGTDALTYIALSAPFVITSVDGATSPTVTQYENVYWFDPDNMTALINHPGHVWALDFLLELANTGSEAQLGWERGTAIDNFLSGNAIATVSWGDVGNLVAFSSESMIQGKLGVLPIACSDTWYDRKSGKFIHDIQNPNCVGNVAGLSWNGVISSHSDNPELAYYLLAMYATPSINFWNMTGGVRFYANIKPSTTNHLFPPYGTASPDMYVNMGFDRSDVKQYIAAYGDSLFSFPTVQDYLRIPGAEEYLDVLDIRLNQAMIGEFEPQVALDLVAQEWEEITDDIGRDWLLEIYQEMLGYSP